MYPYSRQAECWWRSSVLQEGFTSLFPEKENKGRINCDTLSDFLPHIIIYTTLYFHQEALIYAPQFSSYITVLPYFLGLDCVDCIQKGDSFSPHNNSQQQRKTPFYINVSPKKSFGFIGHLKKWLFSISNFSVVWLNSKINFGTEKPFCLFLIFEKIKKQDRVYM